MVGVFDACQSIFIKLVFFNHPDSTWEFLRLILDLSMKVLKQDGKYFTQVGYPIFPLRLSIRIHILKFKCIFLKFTYVKNRTIHLDCVLLSSTFPNS
jgi:hypothetical protein